MVLHHGEAREVSVLARSRDDWSGSGTDRPGYGSDWSGVASRRAHGRPAVGEVRPCAVCGCSGIRARSCATTTCLLYYGVAQVAQWRKTD